MYQKAFSRPSMRGGSAARKCVCTIQCCFFGFGDHGCLQICLSPSLFNETTRHIGASTSAHCSKPICSPPSGVFLPLHSLKRLVAKRHAPVFCALSFCVSKMYASRMMCPQLRKVTRAYGMCWSFESLLNSSARMEGVGVEQTHRDTPHTIPMAARQRL